MKTRAKRTMPSNGFDDRLHVIRGELRSLLDEVMGTGGNFTFVPKEGVDFYEAVAKFEADLIRTALDMCGGNQKRTAKLLNMRESTLCNKMTRLQIPRRRFVPVSSTENG